jgi:hypothetical protein
MTDIVAMARLSICGTGLVLASVFMFAQPPNGGGPGPVLGIVEIPEMFFVDPNSGQYAPRAALTLYTRPDSESKVLVQISSRQRLTAQSTATRKRERSSTVASVATSSFARRAVSAGFHHTTPDSSIRSRR